MNVEFRWSFIYEIQHHPERFDPSKIEEESKDFIVSLIEEWNKVKEGVISYIEELTNLKYKSQKINCYVIHTSTMNPISDPLSIAINFKMGDEIFTLTKERFVDMMIHELIHNLFIENEKETKEYFNKLLSGMYSDNWNISTHVLIHAIHKKIFEKFFEKKRFDEEIESSSYYPDYKTAWEIVEKEGSDEIISKFKEMTSS